jgi:hypothetical protein
MLMNTLTSPVCVACICEIHNLYSSLSEEEMLTRKPVPTHTVGEDIFKSSLIDLYMVEK